MLKNFWKTKLSFLERRHVVSGLKLQRLVKNRIGSPVIYDVFVTAKNCSVCVIAPYYSHSNFLDSTCDFENRGEHDSVPAVIVDEPERGCLIALYPLPESMRSSDTLKVSIQKKKKLLYQGTLPNIISQPKKYALSITTLIKYEAQFMAEWIDHHLRVGVEHFYIYDNNAENDSPIRKAVESYIKKGIATYIQWPYPYKLYNYKLKPFWPEDSHYYTQIPQIHHALYKYAHETEWLLSCDVDEYFYAPGESDMKSVIREYKEKSALQISGYFFDGTAQEVKEASSRGVMVSFQRSEKEPTSPKKMILNTARTVATSIHEIIGYEVAMPVSPDRLRFNHYRALGWKGRIESEPAI
jgi:hypothetical protein